MKPARLSPRELEIMRLLWASSPATVREIYETLRTRRRVAYTTIMTRMGILVRKGYLECRTVGRARQFRPVTPAEATIREVIWGFLDSMFDGTVPAQVTRYVEDYRHEFPSDTAAGSSGDGSRVKPSPRP